MRLLVSGATKTIREYRDIFPDILGHLPTPYTGNNPRTIVETGLPIAADNGCFTGFDRDKFLYMLDWYREVQARLMWVACPDVVGDSRTTLRLWDIWADRIRVYGYTPAFVLQDGITLAEVEATAATALFIGGTDDFKLGRTAYDITRWAVSHSIPVHMGRVNSVPRIEYAVRIGCSSIDGSSCSKWSTTYIPYFCRHIRWFKNSYSNNPDTDYD